MWLSERKNKRYVIVLDQYDENLGKYTPKSHTIKAPTLVEAIIATLMLSSHRLMIRKCGNSSTNYATKFSTMLSARLSTQITHTENSRLWDYTQSLLRITTCTTLQ